ncbi:hypothetical protein TNCV_1404951 [Trichonephila clavipes]|nr:hypothetical protein TNCV_1404951 [Trichonephila clavipes]
MHVLSVTVQNSAVGVVRKIEMPNLVSSASLDRDLKNQFRHSCPRVVAKGDVNNGGQSWQEESVTNEDPSPSVCSDGLKVTKCPPRLGTRLTFGIGFGQWRNGEHFGPPEKSASLLAICEAYSLGFIFKERITKQHSRGDTADGWPDLGLDVKSLVDL